MWNFWFIWPLIPQGRFFSAISSLFPILLVPEFGLILGEKTCETHEWRKTMNAKKPLRSQHNMAKENNYQKKKKNFSGFYTEENPEFGFGFAFRVFPCLAQTTLAGIYCLLSVIWFVKFFNWILAEQYFAGFIFASKEATMKKGINFRDSSDFIFS